MERTKKKIWVDDFSNDIAKCNEFIVASFTAMTVHELEDIRRKARSQGVRCKVVVNNLVKVASKGTVAESLHHLFKGQNIVFMSDEDLNAVKLYNVCKNYKNLKFIGGFSDNAVLNGEDIAEFANMPSLEVIRSKLMNIIISRNTSVVRAISSLNSSIVRLLSAKSGL